MGDIYLATDETLGREVVVKVLAERYAADEAITARFKREGLAAARLSAESGAVTIFDVGAWRGRPFIVMEHLGGGSLDDLLRREGAQPPGRTLAWLEQAAATLDSAHRHGVVHRDVKPANLLLDTRGDLHVADFGIASAAGLDSMTATGTILGTAGYLSPEQAQGERAGPASDLYALAVVAYELLSGHRPFESESPTAEAVAHVNAPVPSIANGRDDLPPALNGVFRRALAKDPAARYGSAAEFVAALRDALAGRSETPVTPQGAQRRRFLLPAALLVGAAAVGAAISAIVTTGGAPGTRTVAGPGQTTTVRQTVAQKAKPPPPPAVSANSHTLNDRGYRLMLQGAYSSALPLFQQAVQRLGGTGPGDPYEAYANYNLGYTLYRLGRCSEAVTYLRRAEQLEPDRKEPAQIRKRAERC
jgi:eukaryotic-like serine/threonine-protein kinase